MPINQNVAVYPEEERRKLLDISCSLDFKDLTPYEIAAILAETVIYIAPEKTFYQVCFGFS